MSIGCEKQGQTNRKQRAKDDHQSKGSSDVTEEKSTRKGTLSRRRIVLSAMIWSTGSREARLLRILHKAIA
jgi:hypothetical protein